MIRTLLFAVGMTLNLLAAAAQTPQVDARAEVAAALYHASATQAAAERAADAHIRSLRAEVETFRSELSSTRGRLADETTETTRLQDRLTEAEEDYVAALGTRDRTYAREIAVFRDAVEDIVSTPEGTAALARSRRCPAHAARRASPAPTRTARSS